MSKVFIGGSRSIAKLPSSVAARIDRIIEGGLTVLVGDAYGADRCVQRYLAKERYGQVFVFHTSERCRNNLGMWQTRSIPASPDLRGVEFYAVKDSAMTEEADYGLMLWDGVSRGTLNNIRNLLHRGKPVVVFLSYDQSFHTIRCTENLATLLS
jgi:hypothetical protein